jgi:sugar lactone lactonase YvrE
MRITLTLAAALCAGALIPSAASADVTGQSTIHRIAGHMLVYAYSGDGGPAIDADLNKPRDSEFGPDGSLYFVDTFNDRVRKIDTDGIISTVAGNGTHGYCGDEIVATDACLSWPHDLFVDDDGNLFIADSNNERIREVTPDGIIHTVVGTGRIGSTGDGGLGTKAKIKYPKTVFEFGGYLYWSGYENRVRRLDLSTGIVSAVAGSTVAGYANGSSADARFNKPQRMQIDSLGDIYLADTGNSAIREIDTLGNVSTVAGTGAKGNGGTSGTATQFALNQPRGLVLDGDTTMYIADSQNQRIRRVDLLTGQLITIAGGPKGSTGDGGPASKARFYQPRGLSMSPDGDLIVADTYNSELRQIDVSLEPPVQ